VAATQVVVAVSDRQVLGQVAQLCRELEVPATSLEGRAGPEQLRSFSLPSSSSWVLLLRVGHQVRSAWFAAARSACSGYEH
jgi:hypothetical protein